MLTSEKVQAACARQKVFPLQISPAEMGSAHALLPAKMFFYLHCRLSSGIWFAFGFDLAY
jgi:hypothetical protein